MSPAPLLALLLALAAASPSQDFARGRIAFERGEWARTIELLRPLVYPEPRLSSEGEVVQAHRMLGVAYLFERQPAQAEQEFRRLLQLRPDYRMDPLLDPPLVVDFFNGVLRQQEAELTELERKRQAAEAEERKRQEAARAAPTVVERRYLRNSFSANFLPFGTGQFQNGQRGKGYFFLASESALAGISVAAFATNFALHGVRPRIKCVDQADATLPGVGGCTTGKKPGPEQDRSKLLMRVQVVSGALFFATAAWGVVDAIVNFRPEVPLPAGPTATTAFAPLLLDGGLGGGLSFRF